MWSVDHPIWISLLEVSPLPGSEYEEWGPAFVNALVAASSAWEAELFFEQSLRDLGWELLNAGETEDFELRRARFEVHAEIRQLADRARATGEVQYDYFHTWRGEQA